MLTRGDRWKEDFQKCLLPGTSPARETARGDTTDGNREKPLNLPVYRERKKKKRKKGKKEDRERGRGLDSTDELCERMYIRGKLTGRYAIIRSLRGLLRRNNHRLPVIITVERVEGWKGRIDVSFRLEIKKKHGRGWRMERSFSTTSNSSEEDVEIAVAFSTPLLLSLSLSLSTYVFLRKFTSRRGLSTYVRNGIINQSREFVMKNVKRSFITKLSIEERESDEIGLPSVSFVNRR